MHRMHSVPKSTRGPETAGATIHWASRYDICERLTPLGMNRPNSRMVVEMAKIKPGDKVLDVGCGTGNLTLTAARYAGASGSVHGIDASPEMIDVARKKAKGASSNAVFEVGLIEKLDFADATFDVVISRLVMHHLPEELKRRGLAEIFRVLKPGGLVFTTDFNPPANPLLAHVALALVGHGRMMHSNLQELAPLLKEAGFVDVGSGRTRSVFLGFVSGKKQPATSPVG